jgi:hypothetical protein
LSEFHKSPAWSKLAKKHKALVCSDCGSTKDIQSGHILPASRFKMSRLWMINLKYQCQPCNLKQGAKLRFDLLTAKLLGLYWMIKIMSYIAKGLVIFILIRFLWLDHQYNASIITDHIKADLTEAYDWVNSY